MRSTVRIILWVVLLAAGAGTIAWSYHVRGMAEAQFANEAELARAEAARIQREVVRFTEAVVPPRVPFHSALEGMGLDPALAAEVVSSAQRVFDLRHFRAGNKLTIGRGILGDLREVHYRIDTDRELVISRPLPPDSGNAPAADFLAEIARIPSETATEGVSGTIQGSLFESIIAAGEKPELAMRLAEIFGWDLDFYTDPRPGDTFRVVVEKKKFSNGETAAYGRILVAEYNNAGTSVPRGAVPRRLRPPGLLHAGWEIDEEGVFALAAEICRRDLVALQRAPLSSDFEGVPRAPRNRLRRADGNSGADDWRRARNVCRTEGRRGESDRSAAHERLHDLLHASIADPRSQRPACGAGAEHRAGGDDGACDRAASRFPNPTARAIFEFRAARGCRPPIRCRSAIGTNLPRRAIRR